MLIGISGKIGSGKDTLAKFIMEAIIRRDSPRTDVNQLAIQGYEAVSNFQIKKFAGKLKEIVCLLTGCTLEQLEDQQFKMTVLGPEWNRTVVEAREWLIMRGWERDLQPPQLGHVGDDEIISRAKEKGFKFERTYREMLQELGTDTFRTHFHPNTWINALFAEYKPGKVTGIKGWGQPKGSLEVDTYPKWLITDVRFPDEAKAIQQRGGKVIRINRILPEMQSHAVATHPSEISLDKFEGFDEIISNNGTLEDLKKLTVEIVTKFNL